MNLTINELEKKPGYTRSIYLAVGFMSTMYTSMLIASASTTAMMSDFPDLGPGALQQMLTLNSLTASIMCLCTGLLTQRFRVKPLAIFSFILMGVFGVAVAFLNNFTLILVCRLIYGIGMGLNLALMPTVITWYLSEKKRGPATAVKQVSINIGMMVFTFLSGTLSALSWRYPFYVYAFSFIVAIAVFIFLPNKENDIAVPKKSGSKISVKLPGYAWGWILLLVASQITLYVWQTNISQLVVTGMGYTTVQTGLAGTLVGLGGIIGGSLIVKVNKALGRFTIPIMFFFYGCTLLVNTMFEIGTPIAYLYVNCLVHGTVYFIYNGLIILQLGNAVQPYQQGLAVSLGVAALQIGNFITPYVWVPLATAIFQRDWPQDRFLLAGCFIMVMVVIFTIIAIKKARISYTYHEDADLANTAK